MSMYVCMCTCVCVCVRTCACMSIYVCVYVCVRAHMSMYVCVCGLTCACQSLACSAREAACGQRRARSRLAGVAWAGESPGGRLSRPRLRRAAAGPSCSPQTCRPGTGRPSVTSVTSVPHGRRGEPALRSAWRPGWLPTLLPSGRPRGLGDVTPVALSLPPRTPRSEAAVRASPGGAGHTEPSQLRSSPALRTDAECVCATWARLAVTAVARGQRGRVRFASAWPARRRVRRI